jgi:uncharacterized protein (DUF58 family)
MRLFDDAALRKLEQLTLAADSVRVGVMKGDRRSRRRGASIEFADYRDYAQGDDLRRLDWNVFARLDRPYIKLTQEEEDLAVHLLVDSSDSMNWPRAEEGTADLPSGHKLRHALQLAGALGYVGLLSGDLVAVSLFDSGGRRNWGPFRGRQNGWPLIQFLEANFDARAGAARRGTALDVALRDYALRAQRPGLLFLISDLLAGGEYRAGLGALLGRGYEIVLLHVLSPDELSPPLTGDLRLRDVETDATVEVTLDPATLEEYAAALDNWRADIAAFCAGRGIHYAPIATDVAWDAIITRSLRRRGVVR